MVGWPQDTQPQPQARLGRKLLPSGALFLGIHPDESPTPFAVRILVDGKVSVLHSGQCADCECREWRSIKATRTASSSLM